MRLKRTSWLLLILLGGGMPTCAVVANAPPVTYEENSKGNSNQAQTNTSSANKNTDGFQAAKAKSCPKPEYPLASIRLGEEGDTEIELQINEAGKVTESRILKSSGFSRLDDAAVASFTACEYEPATKNNKPIAVLSKKRMHWTIEDQSKEHALTKDDIKNFPRDVQYLCEALLKNLGNDPKNKTLVDQVSKNAICPCIEKSLKKDRYLKLFYADNEKAILEELDVQKTTDYIYKKMMAGFMFCTATNITEHTNKIDLGKDK